MTKIAMADVNPGDPPPPTGQPFVYQHACPNRGWNDPPKNVFSPTNAGRKRIDPRKRVSHDISSTGIPPPNPNPSVQPTQNMNSYMNGQAPYPPATVPPMMAPEGANSVTNGIPTQQQMNGHGPPCGVSTPPPPSTFPFTQPNIHHASSNPDVHKLTQQQQQPPPLMAHSSSVPHSLHSHTQYQPLSVAMSGPPKSLTPPQNQSPNKNATGRKLCAPAANIGNTAIFQMGATPTMLQSSRASSKPNSSATSAVTNSGNQVNNQIGAPLASSMPPMNPYNVAPPQPTSLPPMSLPSMLPQDQNNVYSRTNSLPAGPPPTATLPAPPIAGFYKPLNSPLNSLDTSPCGSGASSPVPKKDKSTLENDNEVLTGTVDKLNECHNKCACILTTKNSDDIKKKIELFKTSWSTGKLSDNVKIQMSSLSEALVKSDFVQADSIHKSLIMSHSSEVMSWMVGVKKLISSYQKVLEDNNRHK
jgi:hypothetical protein